MGLHVIDHPLVGEALARLRDRTTDTVGFRSAMAMLGVHLFHEATVDLPTEIVDIETPLGTAHGRRVRPDTLTLVPILRAGLGLLEGVLTAVPGARVAHLGVRRDEETHEAYEYYRNLPASATGTMAYVLDPMLATGGTMIHVLELLEEIGMAEIRVLAVVAAPEGVRVVRDQFPEVELYVAALDEGLNDDAYIVPGLGDAGDRYFGTEG